MDRGLAVEDRDIADEGKDTTDKGKDIADGGKDIADECKDIADEGTCQTIWNYPYWNVSKTIIHPNTRRGSVLSLIVTVEFNGNKLQ